MNVTEKTNLERKNVTEKVNGTVKPSFEVSKKANVTAKPIVKSKNLSDLNLSYLEALCYYIYELEYKFISSTKINCHYKEHV